MICNVSISICTFISWLLLLLNLVNKVASLLPQVSQEGLLRPYRSYADVTLFHYYVPKEVVTATFEFAAFMDSPDCPVRNVYVFLQHGSYPVMSADDGNFPPKFWLERTSMFNITLRSSYQPHDARKFPVNNPLPGSWFAAGYLPNWDQPVQQEGIGHKCQYSLGSIALWTQISTIPLDKILRLRNTEPYTYFKFYIPAGVWKFTLKIDTCRFTTSRRFPSYEVKRDKFTFSSTTTSTTSTTPRNDTNTTNTTTNSTTNNNTTTELSNSMCIQNIFIRARALPNLYTDSDKISCALTDSDNSTCIYNENLPFTDSYYYVVIVSETKISFSASVTIKECPIEMLEKSFIQQFPVTGTVSNTKDQAVTMNSSKTYNTNNFSDTADVRECICPPIYRLTRIKHAQDFSDTFLLQGKQWFTTWLELEPNKSVGVVLELLPYVDIGGTLSINIRLDEIPMNASSPVLTIFGCIRKSRPPESFCCLSSTNISDCCESGLSLHISTENHTTLDDVVFIPYPEPDKWFISLTGFCYLDGVEVSCDVKRALVSLDIRTQPCVLTKPSVPGDPILPCGKYGICQEVHKGQFFYTSCRCIGGYRGWDCSDDSYATPQHILLLTTFLLTLSNLFFIPAIFLALRRRMFTHAIIYLSTMISSTMYHACDQDIYGYCLTRYQVLQFCDFFCSILAFWVTLIALAKSPPKYESAMYMLGALVIAIGVEYNRTGLMVFVVPFCLGIGIPLIVWGYRSIQTRSLIKPNLNTMFLFVPGVFLGAAGLILFAFVETEENYRYTHSAWHVIIALSLVYLLPKKWKNVEAENSADVSNSAELAAVNEYQPNQPSSPIFFITSELDHLVQPNPR